MQQRFLLQTSKHPANRTHNPQQHTRTATWKPQVCTSSLEMHAPVHHLHVHTITTYKWDTWPHRQKPPSSTLQKTYQEHPRTAPTTLDTPYNKPRQHTTLNTENTNSTKLTNYFLNFYSMKYHRQQPMYKTLELLMMGIVVPETCWASDKICNKNLCCI